MRDILLLVILGGGGLYALRRPWIGAILWTWVSLMSPHVEFGWATANYQFGLLIACTTLVGVLLTGDRQNPMVSKAVWALLAFVVWTCITLPFSIHYSDSLELWIRSMKIFLMLFVTLALLDTRAKLDTFIWINVLSVCFYGIKGGIFTIMSGGNFRVWGPGGFIEGNNELAVAVIACIPLMLYLYLQQTRKLVRFALALSMALSAITVLGTHSRGALLGLGAMAVFFWWKRGHKPIWGIAMAVFGLLSLSFMPDEWWSRMDTIRTYEEDASALGRINAWMTAFNLANDRLFGGGFMVSSWTVFSQYAPIAEPRAAHSIYFQILGEHGWIGLMLFLSIGVAAWLESARLTRLAKVNPELRWASELGAMIQVSIVGFGVGGAFLSLAYFDLPYNIMAMAALALRMVMRPANPSAASSFVGVNRVAA